MKRLKANIIAVNVGTPQPMETGKKQFTTAYKKKPVDGYIYLSKTNLAGDSQADLKNHGGEDKALCVYPFDHYPYWEEVLGKNLHPGAFGENLTVKGLVEEAVYIGDVFKWGEALLQVSQPRKPCFKMAASFGESTITEQVIETGFTGFYFRVLKEGMVTDAKPLQFVTRNSDVSIAQINQVHYHEQYRDDEIRRILEVPELADSWRGMLEKDIG